MELLQLEFAREFISNFLPFAAPSKCRPVRPAPPRYATDVMALHGSRSLKVSTSGSK